MKMNKGFIIVGKKSGAGNESVCFKRKVNKAQESIPQSLIRFYILLPVSKAGGVCGCCKRSVNPMEADERGQRGAHYLFLMNLFLQSLFVVMIEYWPH